MTTQSEKESNVKQLGHLPYGGCPKRLPFGLTIEKASNKLLLVDHQLKLKPECFCRLAAQQHTLHKDLEIIHH